MQIGCVGAVAAYSIRLLIILVDQMVGELRGELVGLARI